MTDSWNTATREQVHLNPADWVWPPARLAIQAVKDAARSAIDATTAFTHAHNCAEAAMRCYYAALAAGKKKIAEEQKRRQGRALRRLLRDWRAE